MAENDERSEEARAPRRRPPRRDAPDVRREQILDGAELALVERGLASATIADAAAAAGVAKGTVYLYFDSKTELLAALRARRIEGVLGALESARSNRGRLDPAGSLEQFIDRFFDYSLTQPRLHRLLFHEAGFPGDDTFVALRARVGEVVVTGVRDGRLTDVDAAALADYLVAGLHAAVLAAIDGPPEDARRIREGARTMTRRLLAPTDGNPDPSSSP
jgi:AcrR family transcriptional regulator